MGVSGIGNAAPWSLTAEITALAGAGPPAPPAPAGFKAAATGGASSLSDGARQVAIEAFYFNLRMSFSDADRAATASNFLRYAAGLPGGSVETDPVVGSIVTLSQSILAKTHHRIQTALFSTLG